MLVSRSCECVFLLLRLLYVFLFLAKVKAGDLAWDHEQVSFSKHIGKRGHCHFLHEQYTTGRGAEYHGGN